MCSSIAPVNTGTSRSGVLLAAASITAAAALSFATVAPSSQIFGPVLVAPCRPREIALTFDDGPNPCATPQLLDVLAECGVRATFFLIGRYALAEAALTRRIVAEGHSLGNHTMTHPRLPLCSRRRVAGELADAQHAIEDLAGAAVRLFRPPHGYRTPRVLRTAQELGLTTVTWNVIGNDWRLPTAGAIAARVATHAAHQQRRGYAANIVLHDGSQTTATADRRRSVAATQSLLGLHTQDGASVSLPRDTCFVTLDRWLAPNGWLLQHRAMQPSSGAGEKILPEPGSSQLR